jgi:hypothetical protein
MAIFRCSQERLWIALAAVLGLALTTADCAIYESTGGVRRTVGDRETGTSGGTSCDHNRVADKGGVLSVDRLALSAAARICAESYGDRFVFHSERVLGFSSRTAAHVQTDSNGRPTSTPVRPVSRHRVPVLRVHGGGSLCWGARLAALVAKQRSNDVADDEASDDSSDDDDAYENLDVFDDDTDDDDVWLVSLLAAPIPFLPAPEFATESWVAPLFTRFSTLQQLRC